MNPVHTTHPYGFIISSAVTGDNVSYSEWPQTKTDKWANRIRWQWTSTCKNMSINPSVLRCCWMGERKGILKGTIG